MKASELQQHISDMIEAHGDLEVTIPKGPEDFPIEAIITVLVDDGRHQYFLFADQETIADSEEIDPQVFN